MLARAALRARLFLPPIQFSCNVTYRSSADLAREERGLETVRLLIGIMPRLGRNSAPALVFPFCRHCGILG